MTDIAKMSGREAVGDRENSGERSSKEFQPMDEMYVTKRNGERETVSFDKILQRIKKLGAEAGIKLNYTSLVMKVIDQLYDGISTTKIDELSAEQCASLASTHPDYNILAGRIVVSNHHKNTPSQFSEVIAKLHSHLDKHGKPSSLVSEELYQVVSKYKEQLDILCDYNRDYLIDYFGFKTLDRAYLMKLNGKTVERPQHMWLRVAIGIHGDNMEKIIETYDLMSQKYFTHATPTLFNAGTPHPQLSSCYLLSMESDSIEGIYNTLKDCALISKWAGGIGLHIHNVRAAGSDIRGTNGSSNGIVPMLRVFNNTAKYVDQCVTPDTLLYTKDGQIEIHECIAGITQVVNREGGFETVQKVLEHKYSGPMQVIQTVNTHTQAMRITPEHPIYALKMSGEDAMTKQTIENNLHIGLANLEWVDAKNISQGDYIAYPIPKTVIDYPELTEEICEIYGIILTGMLLHSRNPFTLNSDDYSGWNCITHLPNKINQIAEFFTKHAIKYETRFLRYYNAILWEPTTVLPFSRSDFYTNKQLALGSRWQHLPLNKLSKLLMGLECQNELFYELANVIPYLRLRLGIMPDDCIKYKHFWLVLVISNTEMNYSGLVYDLQMSKEHNYLLEGGLVHNGGGKRNGSFAIYLEPWHSDVELFLQMRKNHGEEELKARDLFYALWIPDLFMERVKADKMWTLMCPDECPGLADVYGDDFKTLYENYEDSGKGRKTMKARDLWFQVLDAQMETGTPYILYKDAANKKSNQKNVGTIKSSNLCVAPETMVLTDEGHIEIHLLEGKKVNVWNGEEFSEVNVFKTGENQELIDVFTSDGCKLSCTKYHKFFIQDTYSKKSTKMVEAMDLKPGDKIIKCDYPIINGSEKMNYAYTHGFFCGDGTYGNKNVDMEERRCKYACLNNHYYCKRHIDFETSYALEKIDTNTLSTTQCNAMSYVKKPIVYLYSNKKELLKYMDYRTCKVNNERIVITLPLDIEEKFFVPLNNTIADKMEWLSGYCDADGTISNNGNNQQLQISSINYDFLMKVKLMLQTCGINPQLKLMKPTGFSNLPDGKGGHKLFKTQPLYRILISSHDLIHLSDIGFSPKRLIIHSLNNPNRSAKQFITITKIINENRVDDTYCFTEPKRHMGIFNGILTGQCTEIIEYSDENETAVCNLASIALPAFVNTKATPPTFDYEKLHEVSRLVTYNLNRIIDVNYYPTPKTKTSNMRHRPIGIGVQGLADVFMMMNLPFISDEAKQINRYIFETIYHASLTESCEISKIDGPYSTFRGSPADLGQLQFDMWNVVPDAGRYDWDQLKRDIHTYGIRNSLLLAPMPTASTSQILGYNECIEPITSNIYSRTTLAGEFIIANKYLMQDLIRLDLWNDRIKNNIIGNHGSIQQIDTIPQEIRDKYKTVWEMPMRSLIDMAADRGAYICQSQSLNLWIEDPNYSSLTSMHFYSWSKGLKTGIYYLRRRGRHQAQQFTIEPEKGKGVSEEHEICEMCSA